MMKKNWFWIVGILAAIVLLATLIGPSIILRIVRQPESAPDYNYCESFYESYEEIRLHLQELSNELGVEIYSHPIDPADDLYIDSFYLPSQDTQKNLIVLTTGVHGMEGYIGAVMLDVFFQEIYPTLDMQDTGVLVVANVNPYGMKYYRRYNENNVDLNRNFILDWESFDLSSNQEYPKVETFLGPTGKIGNAFWHEAGFYLNLGVRAITDGADTISDALLTGQYAGQSQGFGYRKMLYFRLYFRPGGRADRLGYLSRPGASVRNPRHHADHPHPLLPGAAGGCSQAASGNSGRAAAAARRKPERKGSHLGTRYSTGAADCCLSHRHGRCHRRSDPGSCGSGIPGH